MKSKVLTAAALLLAAGVASADVTGTVKNVLVFNDHAVILFDLNNPTGTPPAACNLFNRYAVSLATAQGRAIHAQILAAKLSGATVVVGPTGGCTVDPAVRAPTTGQALSGSEDVALVVMP